MDLQLSSKFRLALTVCKDNVGGTLESWGKSNSDGRLHDSVWSFDAHADHGDDDSGKYGHGSYTRVSKYAFSKAKLHGVSYMQWRNARRSSSSEAK